MQKQQDKEYSDRLCTNCNVALLYPHIELNLASQGIYKCEFCGYCKVIEKEIYKNRVKNQS